MKTLAIDCSGRQESVLIWDGHQVLAEHQVQSTLSHTETLIPSIKDVLSNAELSLSQVGLMAITVGPGTFTGLRIGLSTLKAFYQVFPIPIAPVSTLMALAMPVISSDHLVLVVMDSRHEMIYAAAFADGPKLPRVVLKPHLTTPKEVFLRFVNNQQPIVVLGSAASIYSMVWQEFSKVKILKDETYQRVSVFDVAKLGLKIHQVGQTVSGAELHAQYLKASDAELKKNHSS